MIYFGIENGILPEIGKYYPFLHKGKLHLGECIKNPSSKPVYEWAMRDINNDKIYYPYCSEVLSVEKSLMSASWQRSDKLFKMETLE